MSSQSGPSEKQETDSSSSQIIKPYYRHSAAYAGVALLQFKLHFSLDPRGRESSQSTLDIKIFSFHLLSLTKPHRPLSTSVFVRNHSPVHRSEAFIQPWDPFSKLLLCLWTQLTDSQSFRPDPNLRRKNKSVTSNKLPSRKQAFTWCVRVFCSLVLLLCNSALRACFISWLLYGLERALLRKVT